MNRKSILILTAIVIGVIITILVCNKTHKGIDHFFSRDQEYHYMTLRVMGDIPAGGAEAGEVLSIISRISDGDDEKWFFEWNKAGSHLEKMGGSLKNHVSSGYAFLRAHSYYRNAEFFLSPSDPRRLVTFRKGRSAFYHGIDSLGIRYRKITVPYGKYKLHAVYYPAANGDATKPLLLTCGGFDSTLEEQYFLFIKAALERGYSCLSFEGPGQGSVIREQGLPFTHEWEKPTKAVLDEFLRINERPSKIVMIGSSLGGYLAPRAAAFDNRIDGVVAFGVVYDFGEAVQRKIPSFVQFLIKNGFRGIARTLINLKMNTNTTIRWGIHNAQWTLGVDDPVDVLDAMSKFNLADVAGKIRCHVLIVSGENDHLVPVEQVEKLRAKLVNAKSVTTKIFNVESGGAEHCQMGAFSLFHEELFDWIEKVIK